jgi:hypothetical protein
MNQKLLEQFIIDDCDLMAKYVLSTFRLFILICKPTTQEQLEDMAYDAMDVWGCI